ncbi:DUF6612 family protein [Shouchella xiaoxiensis]
MSWLAVAPASALMLVACGSGETNGDADDANGDSSTGEEATETSEQLTVEEVLTNTTEAMSDINSYRTELAMAYNMAFTDGESEEQMDFAFDVTADSITEPLALYMDLSMTASEMGMTIGMEQYIQDGIMYMQNPMGGEWLKMDMSDELAMAEDYQMDTQEQIDLLLDSSDQVTMTEDGDSYVLTLEGDEASYQELIQSFMEMGQDDMMMSGQDMEMMMESLDIENMSYTLTINQDTFLQEAVTMTVDMMIEEEGEMVTVSMNVDGTFSMYDEIDEIDVPQEAIDNAVNIEESMGGFEMEEEEESDL